MTSDTIPCASCGTDTSDPTPDDLCQPCAREDAADYIAEMRRDR